MTFNTSYWWGRLHCGKWRGVCSPGWRRGSWRSSRWRRTSRASTDTWTSWDRRWASRTWSPAAASVAGRSSAAAGRCWLCNPVGCNRHNMSAFKILWNRLIFILFSLFSRGFQENTVYFMTLVLGSRSLNVTIQEVIKLRKNTFLTTLSLDNSLILTVSCAVKEY